MPPVRIAALASHPVMYQCQLYRLIAADSRVSLKVIFASNAGVRPYRDSGFGGRLVQWDSDLLSGYDHTFLMRANQNNVERFFDLTDWDVLREITPARYDVLWVHSYSFLTLWLAIVGAKLRRMPVMVREEQTLLHGRPWWKAGARSLTLRTLFRGSHGLSVGTNNGAFFRHYGIPEGRIHLVPYTTNNEEWQQEARRLRSDRQAIRASFGIKHDSPVILFVGKLQEKKAPGLLIEAFRRVHDIHPCTLLLVGTGDLELQMRQTVAEQSVPDVIFAGFLNRSEISRAYVAADIFVLPSSTNETWGMVVNEAMNFALPIVVSDKVGCAPDLIKNGDNGYVFNHHSVEELTSLIGNLVRAPELRVRLGRRSLVRISDWSPQVAANGLVSAVLAAVNTEDRVRHPAL